VVEGGLDHVPEHKHCTVHTFPLYRISSMHTVLKNMSCVLHIF
jgi:hypothetical protein